MTEQLSLSLLYFFVSGLTVTYENAQLALFGEIKNVNHMPLTQEKKRKNSNDFKVLEPCKAISNELKTAQQIIASELEEHFESLLVQIPHFAHEVMNLP